MQHSHGHDRFDQITLGWARIHTGQSIHPKGMPMGPFTDFVEKNNRQQLTRGDHIKGADTPNLGRLDFSSKGLLAPVERKIS